MGFANHITELPVHDLKDGSSPFLVRNIAHANGYDFTQKHRHSYYEILFFENGGGRQLIDFVEYEVKDYSCFIVHPNQVHLLERSAGSNGQLIQFRSVSVHSKVLFGLLRKQLWCGSASLIFEENEELFVKFFDLLTLYETGDDEPLRNERNQQLLQLILFDLLLIDGGIKMGSGADQSFNQFLQIVESNFLREHGVQFYVDDLGLTSKKLSALCKQHLGLSPLKVLHQRILLEAKRLLLFGDVSHKEICFQLGFENPANFSAFVKKNTGQSPTELQSTLEEMHKGKP